MSCGCGENNVFLSKKKDLIWTLNRAKQIAKLRQEDVQIYKQGDLYEIEFPLRNRNNIIEIIRWQELE